MDDGYGISRVAALLAEPARAAMLITLADGTSRPAGELAFAARVSAQSASGHLARLVEGGLVAAEAQGRHRYFRIATPEAARMVKSLASFGAGSKAPRKPPPAALARSMPGQFMHSRTCYDHLAGAIAVAALDAMVKLRWLVKQDNDYQPTRLGCEKLAALGVDLEPGASRRAYAPGCVDLTQRRPHLAGTLGAALLKFYVREAWVTRQRGSRVVTLTPKGRAAFKRELGLTL